MRKGVDMKKLFSIATILILVFSLFCISCTQEPSEQNPTDNMTDSYRAARQKVHDSSNIWLPELEGVEITNTDITENGAKPLVNISFAGDEALFNQLAAYLNEKTGKNPDMNEANMKWWELQYTDKGQAYVGNISIYFNNDNITVASHFFRGFTVTLSPTPANGGTVSFKLGGTPVEGPSFTTAENSDMDLVAAPADGYEFAGWYKNNTLLSDKANYMDFKVPGENVTIEARFSEKQTNMTDYYAAGREKFHQIRGVWLPELEGVGSENTAENIADIQQYWSETNITFDLAGGITEDACNALLAFMKTQYGDNPTEDHDTSMTPVVYVYEWTIEGIWYQLHYQVG
ncbi:MAG: hypothetical protein IKT95_04385, partial [Spirochaetales bacterium]|nr:hypothetical protein [Spirochaetales bacterium]